MSAQPMLDNVPAGNLLCSAALLFSRSTFSKISTAGKNKGPENLIKWCQSISNHLWWSSKTCDGSVEILLEKWHSLMHHCTKVHAWTENQYFHKCAHGALSREVEGKKKWLVPFSPPPKALEKIVYDKMLSRDLKGLTDFCHTGDLEVFHNMCLKYRHKRLHFGIDGMEMMAAQQSRRAGGGLEVFLRRWYSLAALGEELQCADLPAGEGCLRLRQS
ncbi:uncharacterized protein [Ambystoma mexicanum]|uniref:uncharacterized protein n=1 Tax=Ambystoma mexicanum TaxID=8296 RepID=UPI0037E73E19